MRRWCALLTLLQNSTISDSLSMLPPGILKARGYAKGKHPFAPDRRMVVPQPAARCKMRCSRQRIALHRDEVATFQHDQKSKNSRVATSEPVGSLLQGSGKVRNVVDQAKDAPYKDEYCCAVLVNGKFLSKYPEASAAAAAERLHVVPQLSERGTPCIQPYGGTKV